MNLLHSYLCTIASNLSKLRFFLQLIKVSKSRLQGERERERERDAAAEGNTEVIGDHKLIKLAKTRYCNLKQYLHLYHNYSLRGIHGLHHSYVEQYNTHIDVQTRSLQCLKCITDDVEDIFLISNRLQVCLMYIVGN